MKKTLRWENATLTYHVYGEEGEAIVLLHGFGETAAVWNRQVDFLKNNYRLIVPDLPGTGESEMISEMSMAGMAAAIKVLVDKECGDEPIILIGHSMGGYIAMAYAEAFANTLKGLGLFHSSAYADNEEKKATRRKGIEFIREHGAYEFLKSTAPKLFSEKTKTENPDLIRRFVESLSNFSGDVLVSYYEGMIARPDRTEVLETSKFPVLFIAGEHDTAIPLQDVLKQCRLPEKAYIHTLSGSGHLGMLEEPETSCFLLAEYLQDLSTSTPNN